MPFVERRVTWLELNDMAILYEDAGLSANDIAKQFKIGKAKVLDFLKRMGVEIRSKGGMIHAIEHQDLEGERQVVPVRSRNTYRAFVAFQLWLRDRGIDAEVGSAGVGSGFYIELPDQKRFHDLLSQVVPHVRVDEDVDSLFTGITRRWKLGGEIFAGGDDRVESYGYKVTITVPTADFVKLADFVTQKAR